MSAGSLSYIRMTVPLTAAAASTMLRIELAWRAPLATLFLVVAGTLWLYWSTFMGMVSLWRASDTYAHGFVVPLITVWLIWRLRAKLAAMVPRTSWLAVGGALLMAAVWSAGDLVAVNAVTQLALVTLVVLWVIAMLGWPVARVLAFPLGFLYFAVPIGDFLLPAMMDRTADFTVLALRASGIPVYREGLQFVIPSGTWSVVEACSGIRYLIASVTVGCLFAYLSYNGWRKRLLFVAFSVLVPLVANWMRAYFIVMIGHLSGNELATGVDHLIYGWVFFGVVILGMLLVGARYADAPAHDAAVAATRAPQAVDASRRGASPAFIAVACLVVAALPHALNGWWASNNKPGPVVWSALSVQPPWQSGMERPASWSPAFQHASATFETGYVAPNAARIGLHVSYYRQQDYERKLVTSSNVLVTSDDTQWSLVVQGTDQAAVAGHDLNVTTAVLRGASGAALHGGQRLLVWRFYWVDDTFTSSDVEAKLRGAWGRVAGRGDDGAIVVLSTPLNTELAEPQGRAAAAEALRAFMATQGAALRLALQSTREGR